jgi:LacI family transcriptional regulator, gluconate utilization system Gnt-I transcriptional repressor
MNRQPGRSGVKATKRAPARPAANRKATIRDVSRLAHVSRMTVSRYFSNPDLVLPATRERVAQAVSRLSYVPDRAAGSLTTRRSGFIALILPTLTNSNFAAAAKGLTEILRPLNYQLLVGYTSYSIGEEERQIELMLARRPEAIIVTGEQHSRRATTLLMGAGVPVVELADLPSRPIDRAVGFSNRDVGRVAAAHFISQGYKNIGAIAAGRTEDMVDFRGDARLESFEEALKTAGLRTDLVLRHGEPPVSYAHGAAGLSILLEREPKLEAVFAISDVAAVGLMMECRRRRIDIPRELAVIGFGDFDIAAEMEPPLTTIGVKFDELGRETGTLIVDLLRGLKPPESRVTNVGVSLIRRGTTPDAG